MIWLISKRFWAAALLGAVAFAPAASWAQGWAQGSSLTYLQAQQLIAGCQAVVSGLPSAVGHSQPEQWCAAVNREGVLLLEKATDTGGTPQNPLGSDAWRGSIEIASAKAYSAVAFSSKDLAISTFTLGLLSRRDGLGSTASGDIGHDAGVASLWGIWATNPYNFLAGDSVGVNHHGIVTFAGGQPVYSGGVLLGALGSSGDGVDEDDSVTICAILHAGFDCKPTGGCPTPVHPCP